MEKLNKKSGQAVTEYILLMAALLSVAFVILDFFRNGTLADRLAKPIQEGFKRTYQYGAPNVKGLDEDGGPENHPRAAVPSRSNFRIFLHDGRNK